jgi:hypothetical protein
VDRAADRIVVEPKLDSLAMAKTSLWAVLLLIVASFCAYGFQASFEPGTGVGSKIVYAVIGLSCFIGSLLLMMKRGKE